jgi:ribosomal protein L29
MRRAREAALGQIDAMGTPENPFDMEEIRRVVAEALT